METTPHERGWKAPRRLARGIVRLELPLLALWLVLATGLAAITGRVVDWFVMTDELLYERLAISVSRLHSPLPHVHGDLIPNASQLYPLLIAPAFAHGYVPASLHSAHILNAFVMTSAVIPAFLLTRSVTHRRSAAYLVALLSVCVPWIVFSSFLLTEVAAYPAFIWAVLALHRATVAPRVSNDALALAGIGLATFARTQFFVLVLVLAPAILIEEIAFADGGTRWARTRSGVREAVARHRLLAGFYAFGTVAVIVLSAAGRLSSTVGTYAQAVEGNPFPAHFIPSLAEHVSAIALALAVLPFVVGAAWLVAGLVGASSRERRAFAAVGTLTIVVLAIEVTSFDLRFGGGVVRERYFFYVVPIVLAAFAGALCDKRWPRWSLLVPLPVILYGFWHSGLPQYPKLNIDTPVSTLHDELLKLVHTHRAAHVTLLAGTILLTALFVEASILRQACIRGRGPRVACRRRAAARDAVRLPASLCRRRDSRQATHPRPRSGVRLRRPHRRAERARVTMVPYPVRYADYWAGVGFWWDMEFWNKSVDRAAHLPGMFEWTPSTFPKLRLHFDPRTGAANRSPTHVRRREQQGDAVPHRRAHGSLGRGHPRHVAHRCHHALARRMDDVRAQRRRLDEARCSRAGADLSVLRAKEPGDPDVDPGRCSAVADQGSRFYRRFESLSLPRRCER